MTLGDALRALHQAGRIRSPWLAGMRVRVGRDTPRIMHVYLDGWLHLDWPGMPGGMREWPTHATRTWEFDLTDPATVGCLLALLREASGDPRLLPQVADEDGIPRWSVGAGTYETTEGEAIAAALIALAQETP